MTTSLLPQYPEVEALLRIILAGVVAGLIGLDRELKDKPAGIRTYGLVAMGSCLFTLTGVLGFGAGDPAARIAAQIVTGIGFLGAGTIIHMRRGVVGLTTAAGLWAVAAVGMAIGVGLYILGVGGGVIIFFVLRFLSTERIEGREQRTDRKAAPEGDAMGPMEDPDAAGSGGSGGSRGSGRSSASGGSSGGGGSLGSSGGGAGGTDPVELERG